VHRFLEACLYFLSIRTIYKTGSEFTNVCERIVMLEEGYFDIDFSQQYQTTGIDLDAIMIKAEDHERLLKADTTDGRAYRWWLQNVQYISRVCGNRLAESIPADDY